MSNVDVSFKKSVLCQSQEAFGVSWKRVFFLIDWSVDNDCVLMFQVADKNEQT